jgi:hypothetical protein
MTEEIVRADKQYRFRLFTAYIIVLICLVLFAWIGWPRLLQYVKDADIISILNTGEICLMIFLALCVIPTWILFVHGRKIIHYKQVPYPGMKVIHDTKIITGKKATRIGKLFVILSIVAIIIFAASAFRSHYIFEKMRHFNPFNTSTRVV